MIRRLFTQHTYATMTLLVIVLWLAVSAGCRFLCEVTPTLPTTITINGGAIPASQPGR